MIVSLFGVYNVAKSLDVFYNKAFTASYTAGNLRASVQNIGRTILSIATEGVNVDRQEQLAEIDAILSEMDTNLTILKEQMPDNELVNQLRESLKNQKQYREPVIEALKRRMTRSALVIREGLRAQCGEDEGMSGSDYRILQNECGNIP